GKILVSATKHYSWPKAAEILGFGRQNIVLVEVDENMRMDIDDLRNKLVHCVEHREPIVSVIAIAGATESSAVDYIDKIKETRDWLEKEYNSSFFIHIDAAYGGYVKSLFLDKDNNIKPYEKVKEYMGGIWPSKELYNAFCSFNCADSITIDPHKLGYLPYPAGAILYKNKITKSSTVSHAPYISSATKPEDEDLYFGEYVLEGSKSGAAAAACWLAHRVTPLNDFGYGKFLKNEIIDAQYILNLFKQEFPKVIGGKRIDVKFFNGSDIDILLYAFNFEGNDDIDVFNEFNEKILKKMCFVPHKDLNKNKYMVVSTTLDYKSYKNSINNNLKSLGLDIQKWIQRKSCVNLFRTVVMNVNLYTDELKEYYYRGFINEFVNVISEVLKEMNISK
ncbi:MAG: pyridoxal-dependent decarboxylase, partial [bacterium]|nr:pyridoxal-dependent decarboxylase [bacterium]